MIHEGKAIIDVKKEKIVSKDMPVFYNPVMELNRSSSVLLLNALNRKAMQIGLPLEGSGIRGIRFFRELRKGMIKHSCFNDYSDKAVKSIKANLRLNKIKGKFTISRQDATLFLLNSTGFDYIDLDPFGTPNPFLDAAVKRISREGILAVTATDTSALSGTYPDACRRKYWAEPLKNDQMHEIGIRILIRKVQLIGAQFDKALTPVFSYSSGHYMRIFFLNEKAKGKVDKILSQHGRYMGAGPLWLGKLWDESLAEKMWKENREEKFNSFYETIKEESKISTIGFYHLPALAKKLKLSSLPRQETILKEIKKQGYKASATHFKENSMRSDIPEDKLVNIIR